MSVESGRRLQPQRACHLGTDPGIVSVVEAYRRGDGVSNGCNHSRMTAITIFAAIALAQQYEYRTEGMRLAEGQARDEW